MIGYLRRLLQQRHERRQAEAIAKFHEETTDLNERMAGYDARIQAVLRANDVARRRLSHHQRLRRQGLE